MKVEDKVALKLTLRIVILTTILNFPLWIWLVTAHDGWEQMGSELLSLIMNFILLIVFLCLTPSVKKRTNKKIVAHIIASVSAPIIMIGIMFILESTFRKGGC